MKIVDYEISGIDRKDHPDYVDAYFTWAVEEGGRELSDDELDDLGESLQGRELIYNRIMGVT